MAGIDWEGEVRRRALRAPAEHDHPRGRRRMSCCQCDCYAAKFSDNVAEKDLRRYRRKGPDKTTRMLLDALEAEGVDGLSLLDIGGGIGAITHKLLATGVRSAVHVDAALPYVRAAEQEAVRQGHADRVSFHHGDFVALATEIAPADIVTLDRVICCYADMEELVAASASRALRFYGVVYPRDTWWMKLFFPLENLLHRLRRSRFRTYLHPTGAIDTAVQRQGLRPRSSRNTLVWRVVMYSR
jgi:hypothetical protein